MKQISDVDTTTSSRPLLVVGVVMDRPRWRVRIGRNTRGPASGAARTMAIVAHRPKPRNPTDTRQECSLRRALARRNVRWRASTTGSRSGGKDSVRARLGDAVLPHLRVE